MYLRLYGDCSKGWREGGREVSAIEYVHEALNGTGVEFNYTALSDVQWEAV